MSKADPNVAIIPEAWFYGPSSQKHRKRWHARVVHEPHAVMGPFGGGWKWCLGLEVGRNTIVLNLVRFFIRFDRS